MGKAVGVKMDMLMRMQASYDIAQTGKRENQIHVRRIHQVVSVTTHERTGVSRSRRSA
jgi:plasmid maintenance system antidote protein VapI